MRKKWCNGKLILFYFAPFCKCRDVSLHLSSWREPIAGDLCSSIRIKVFVAAPDLFQFFLSWVLTLTDNELRFLYRSNLITANFYLVEASDSCSCCKIAVCDFILECLVFFCPVCFLEMTGCQEEISHHKVP